jgi:curved DNA-binding protein CbpA
MHDVDYYLLLGVGPEAEPEEIYEAYQRKIAEAGTDVERARLLVEARLVLLDPVGRAAYDSLCVGHDLIEETVAAIFMRLESRRG